MLTLKPARGLQGPDPGGAGFEAAEEGVRVAVGRLLRRLGKLGLWRTSAPLPLSCSLTLGSGVRTMPSTPLPWSALETVYKDHALLGIAMDPCGAGCITVL